MPRAILSVYDKTGIEKFVRLSKVVGWELVSTGGTADALGAAGGQVVEVSEATGFPEILGGRVKTLHPAIHGGILADPSNPTHVAELEKHGILPASLVVVNLYPFEREAAKLGARIDDVLESMDIGGVALIRAAVKSFWNVTVVVDPVDYDGVITDLIEGLNTPMGRFELARKAIAYCAHYDAAISAYFAGATRRDVYSRA